MNGFAASARARRPIFFKGTGQTYLRTNRSDYKDYDEPALRPQPSPFLFFRYTDRLVHYHHPISRKPSFVQFTSIYGAPCTVSVTQGPRRHLRHRVRVLGPEAGDYELVQ